MTHVNFTTSGVALTDNQIARIQEIIEYTKRRSAWDKGVKMYALELLEKLFRNAGLCEGNRGLYAAVHRKHSAEWGQRLDGVQRGRLIARVR